MRKNTLILTGILLVFVIPLFLFGFVDGPKRYHKQYERAWLGVSTKNLTPQLCDYFGVEEETGVLVSQVVKDSPAEKSGLKAGDVIVNVDDEIIRSKNDLVNIIQDFDPGDEITIDFIRNRREETINVELGKSKSKKHYYFSYKPERIDIFIPEMDIEIPEIEFEMPEFDKEELENLQEKINEEMKHRNEELKEHMEGLRERMKELRIEMKNELRETI